MRWSGQQVLEDGVGAAAALPGLRGLLRSVRTPGFAGTVFHEVEARSLLNRVPGSSPVPFRWTVNPYRGCSHACVYCLAGDTRVLMADGSTRPIAALRVGDVVIGTEKVDGAGSRGQRRYVPTTVSAHWSTTKPAVRVRLAGGTEIVASGEHRFLTDRGWRHVTGGWCRAGRRPRLRPGAALLGPGPFAAAPTSDGPDGGRERTTGYRRGYLCGLVRADGDEPGRAEPDRVFPSAHLELEVLGRAHHYLAVERGSRHAPVLAAVGGVVDGRIAPPSRAVAAGPSAPVDEMARWPQRPGRDWCAGFLAGVLDARGTTGCGELRLRHTDEQVVGRIAGALHRLGFRFAMERPAGSDRAGSDRAGSDRAGSDRAGSDRVGSRRVVRLLGGAGAFIRFLQLTGPAVARGRDLVGAPVEASASMRVVSVERTGQEEAMYDITTGTGDFVAEGAVSHNCFARGTHTYLDMDAGDDFDRQIVVKVNAARVLERELRAPRWAREPVAMGTNTDPYQRAEGRYALMPGILDALARSGTPFSLLTKGTVLTRDLPRIAAAAADVPVGIGVSIALLDRPLQSRLEPGTPSPEARLDLVRRITDAGLACGVMVAPVLPLLTDSTEALDALLGRIRAAGATSASVLALHLRPGTREWFLAWLAREHPRLVAPYERLYRRGAYVDRDYRRALGERVAPLLRRHRLAGAVGESGAAGQIRAAPGPGELARAAVHAPQPGGEQLSLL